MGNQEKFLTYLKEAVNRKAPRPGSKVKYQGEEYTLKDSFMKGSEMWWILSGGKKVSGKDIEVI